MKQRTSITLLVGTLFFGLILTMAIPIEITGVGTIGSVALPGVNCRALLGRVSGGEVAPGSQQDFGFVKSLVESSEAVFRLCSAALPLDDLKRVVYYASISHDNKVKEDGISCKLINYRSDSYECSYPAGPTTSDSVQINGSVEVQQLNK